jgi:hypothetical protein
MAKPNKKQIERLLAEGAELTATINEIAAMHAEALTPITEAYQQKQAKLQERMLKEMREARADRADELDAALERRSEIEAEIRKELELGISGNEVAVCVIEHAGAKAAVEQTKQEATLEPRALLEAVPKAEQDEAFFACLKVQIQAARKYLGKKFEELSNVKKHFAVTVKWS